MAQQCTATAKSSGKRCEQPAIPGGTVCRYHGGAAPQVRARARERLATLVDPAIDTLSRLVRDKKTKAIALAAAKDILDRNDLSGKTIHEHTGTDGGPLAFTLKIDGPSREDA